MSMMYITAGTTSAVLVDGKTFHSTPWFEGEVNPVHVGVYERDYTKTTDGDEVLGTVFNYWDGEHWILFGYTIQEAAEEVQDHFCNYSNHQHLPWRGLTKPAV